MYKKDMHISIKVKKMPLSSKRDWTLPLPIYMTSEVNIYTINSKSYFLTKLKMSW
jgi:hypothetical protein